MDKHKRAFQSLTAFHARALGSYDDGRKVLDNDQPDLKGHDRYLVSALCFRPGPRGLVSRVSILAATNT